MTIEKLERVMWRLGGAPNQEKKNTELERAIMHEIGTDPRTLRLSRSRLIKLGWLRSKGSGRVIVTGKHIEG